MVVRQVNTQCSQTRNTVWRTMSNCLPWKLTICREHKIQQAVHVATQFAPAPLLPSGRLSPRMPPSRHNVAVLVHAEYVPTLTVAAALHVKAMLSKAVCDLDLSPFDLESGVWVTRDVGYLCANFGLPRPLCSRVMPNVCDRQMSDRQTSDKSIA